MIYRDFKKIAFVFLFSVALVSCTQKSDKDDDKNINDSSDTTNANADIGATFDTNDYLDEALEDLDAIE